MSAGKERDEKDGLFAIIEGRPQHHKKPDWSWARYDDVGSVIELFMVHDDALKKDTRLLVYSVSLANVICEDMGFKAIVTWGKWGGRLEPKLNGHMSRSELEDVAEGISAHPAWLALSDSTEVFTYGNSHEEFYDWFQAAADKAGDGIPRRDLSWKDVTAPKEERK